MTVNMSAFTRIFQKHKNEIIDLIDKQISVKLSWYSYVLSVTVNIVHTHI